MQPHAPPTVRIGWPSPPPGQRLQDSEVHVWAVALNVTPETLSALTPILSAPELERAARFHFAHHRSRFVIGRAVLRLLLSRYLQTQPAALQFTYGPHGKPLLADTSWHFNLTHSEDLALLALTRSGSIGVDVEYTQLMPDADQLVARFFSDRERLAFQQLPAAQQAVAFFNLWTRKEAWLKATGDGIGHLLNQVEVSFLPGEPAQLLSLPEFPQVANLSSSRPSPADSSGQNLLTPEDPSGTNWSLHDLAPAPGFAAALAVAKPPSGLHCWRLDEKDLLRSPFT